MTIPYFALQNFFQFWEEYSGFKTAFLAKEARFAMSVRELC